MTISKSVHHADYSRERRRTAISYLRGECKKKKISSDALLMLTVGLLICDARGYIPKAALDSAMGDLSVLNAARALIQKAGL